MGSNRKEVALQQTILDGESYFKISNHDLMRPFFMSIVSDSNHWMFISSNGGLSAGRKNAQNAIFPYYTDDKITESHEVTGSKTIIRIKNERVLKIWEPFSIRQFDTYKTRQNLYKNSYGNKIVFEEVNEDLNLIFRYQWASSNAFGFVRTATIINTSNNPIEFEIIDGIQNLVPHGVESGTQNRASNLVDAYKRNELVSDVGLGIYALSAIIVDKAEPSEALKANVAWSLGLDDTKRLVSSLQLNAFREGQEIHEELDIKGEKGAYFVNERIILQGQSQKQWHIVTNVTQDHSAVIGLCEALNDSKKLEKELLEDVQNGSKNLVALNASSDGLQCTSDELKDARHFSNTLFNIMRGGIFDENYQIEREDFKRYIEKANKLVFQTHKSVIETLPEVFTLKELTKLLSSVSNSDFERLAIEYLPLKFSRRHGDPSRPWNIFSINTNSEIDGSKILDYQGNWRDIFQNWEALAYAYPEFIDGMLFKFLNASTFDGYNPYRVLKDGFDWEVIEPDDPWSYIGYWGDHQIIYSLKFLEFIQKHFPRKLEAYFDKAIFVYANVPYKIKSYQELLINPKDTIDFDEKEDVKIRSERKKTGGDAALLKQRGGDIHRVNFIEKVLASMLAKLSNFIPEGGIWMNTQRPEWNDANNALVGNGVSMVTLYYLRRYLSFFGDLLDETKDKNIPISKELKDFFDGVYNTLSTHQDGLNGSFTDALRRVVLDGLGRAASEYRLKIYKSSFSGEIADLSLKELKDFIHLTLRYLEHSIESNKRSDDLYHAYNLMTVQKNGDISISYLSEMLEGQVAVLSSGKLNGSESLEVLDALKTSALFREDQYSYILYPNKNLPGFLQKNVLPKNALNKSVVLKKMIDNKDFRIVSKDVQGNLHFNGNFKNANDLKGVLKTVGNIDDLESEIILGLFEEIFDHKSFTGRSGTFFGYEGLGSIYWHMVSKLLLAVQECCLQALEFGESPEIVGRLMEHYYEINEGIGVHKPPSLYGAFPTDPYSHTPAGRGAQQPGMTGQVKEDILSRFGELGVRVENGQLIFEPVLLKSSEFNEVSKSFDYVDVNGSWKSLQLEPQTLAFTYCQIPVVYHKSDNQLIHILNSDGSISESKGHKIGVAESLMIFQRIGEIIRIDVFVDTKDLK